MLITKYHVASEIQIPLLPKLNLEIRRIEIPTMPILQIINWQMLIKMCFRNPIKTPDEVDFIAIKVLVVTKKGRVMIPFE